MAYNYDLDSSTVEVARSIDVLDYITHIVNQYNNIQWWSGFGPVSVTWIRYTDQAYTDVNLLYVTEWHDFDDNKNYLIQLGESNHFFLIRKIGNNMLTGAVEYVDNKYHVIVDFGTTSCNGIPVFKFTEIKKESADTIQYAWQITDSSIIDRVGYNFDSNFYLLNDGVNANSTVFNNLWWSVGLPYEPTPIDPNKGNDGNKGDYDNGSDPINQPTPPTNTPINNGLLHSYVVDSATLTSLGNFLWSNSFIDTIYKNFSSPMEAIISLCQCRYDVPKGSGTTQIKIGNCESGVYANQVTTNYCIVDCGSIDVKEYFGNSLDYDPYTKLSMMLPYVGYVPLDTDICMKSTLTVKYLIDCITGVGLAYIYVSKVDKGTTLQAPIYTYPCNCNVNVPVSASDFTSVYSSAISGLLGVAQAKQQGSMADGIQSVANAVFGAKSHVDKAGSISGSSGIFSVQKPYLVIERPINAYAENYPKYYGLPCNMTYQLSKCKGFTKVDKIKVSSINKATDTEKDMIISILKEGVYI